LPTGNRPAILPERTVRPAERARGTVAPGLLPSSPGVRLAVRTATRRPDAGGPATSVRPSAPGPCPPGCPADAPDTGAPCRKPFKSTACSWHGTCNRETGHPCHTDPHDPRHLRPGPPPLPRRPAPGLAPLAAAGRRRRGCPGPCGLG